MTKDKIIPTKNECSCCMENKVLSSCVIKQCDWKLCADCYEQIYNDENSIKKCPACRNNIIYKPFTPNVNISNLEELHIDVDNLERGEISIRMDNSSDYDICHCCSIKIYTSCYNRRRRNNTNNRRVYDYLCNLYEIVFGCILFAFAILFGRWVIWLLFPRGLVMGYLYFWIPIGWFILYGLLGFILTSLVAILSCFFIAAHNCCEEELNNDW